jgi:hypothetical protein
MDPRGTLYVGEHQVGLFHHSSFIAGGIVAGAGEMSVADGKLRMITSKSGHYQPTPDQTRIVLLELQRHGVGLERVPLKVWIKDPAGRGTHTQIYDDAAAFAASPKTAAFTIPTHDAPVERTLPAAVASPPVAAAVEPRPAAGESGGAAAASSAGATAVAP